MRRLALVALALLELGCPPRTRPHVGSAREVPLVEPGLRAALSASLASERARAAFQLGQLGVAWDPRPVEEQAEAEGLLLERRYLERDPAVRVEIVAALGRVGRARARRALLDELAQPGPGRARAGWALAHLYRRLRDAADPSPDLPALEQVLAVTPEAEVRAAVTDAAAEMQRPAAHALLVRSLKDADPLTRARAARGLVAIVTADDVPALERALADPDERVAAASALALAQLAERGIAPALAVDVLTRSLERLARPAVVIALSEAGLLRPELAPVFAQLKPPSPRLACAAALAHDRILGRVDALASCTVERDLLAIRVFAETDPKRARGAVEALLAQARGDAKHREVAAAALARYEDPRARARVVELAADPDPIAWSGAAEGAALAKLGEAGPALLAHAAHAPFAADDVGPQLTRIAALEILRPADAAQAIAPLVAGTPAAVALAARDALAQLGAPAKAQPAILRGPYDELALDGAPIARLETARGPIRIRLRPDRAPRTARNFVGLVRRSFYDGLSFHRIVPGFVAQGGDPRGDGSGSAGHLVACEPNPLPYGEGSVGMALSGLDTGSSQFFIALAPAPHLEGRYTAFGEVVEGMAVARALEPGDVITRATIE